MAEVKNYFDLFFCSWNCHLFFVWMDFFGYIQKPHQISKHFLQSERFERLCFELNERYERLGYGADERFERFGYIVFPTK